MPQFAYYENSFGLWKIGYEEECIICVKRINTPDTDNSPSPISDQAAHQLLEYLEGNRASFTVPVRPEGTPFQLAVWDALMQIPYGETKTYAQIAAAIKNPKACRAVGQAANRNPLWILIPCHRVVGSNHSLTGYAGGLNLKQELLDLERCYK